MRNTNIDAIKAIACYFVVLIHVSAPIVTTAKETSINWWLANILQSFIFWPVPAFLMASGYFLLTDHKRETIKEYYKKRIIKLIIPSIFWIIGYLIWGYYVRSYPQTPADFATALVTGNVSDHLYFLFAISGIYILVPFLRHFLRSTNGKIILCFGLTYSLFWVADYAINRAIGQWGGNLANLPLIYLGYFIIGHGFRIMNENKEIHPLRGIFWCVLILGIVCYIPTKYFEAYSTSYDIRFYYANSYFSIPLFLISISVFPLILTSEIIKKLGRIEIVKIISFSSFGIYVLHVALLDTFYILLNYSKPKLITAIFFESFLFFVVSLLIVLVIQLIPGFNIIAGGPNKALQPTAKSRRG